MAHLEIRTHGDGQIEIQILGVPVQVRKALQQLDDVIEALFPTAQTLTFLLEGKTISMLTMKDTQKATVTLAPKDSKGQKAPIDGVPAWASSDSNVVTLNIAADGLSADVIAGNPGTAQVQVQADANMDPGTVTTITGLLDVQILPGDATVIDLQAGAPVEQAAS